MLTPEAPPRIQTLQVTSVRDPSDELRRALAAAVARFEGGGSDLAPLVLPLRRVAWVACDGARRGAALLEGSSSRVDVRVEIDLDAEERATLVPVARHETLPA